MKSIVISQSEGQNKLEMDEQPRPEANENDLLIKVKMAAVNRTDILIKETNTSYGSNPIPGVEVAGTVVEADSDHSFAVGDRVMGLVNRGGYAEYAVMPADRAMKIPESLSFKEGAAIPEVFLTAYQTLFWIGKLQKNDTVLIHAGASGVGTAAIQLAKQLTGAKIIVTAGTERKLQFCSELGADVTINYKKQPFDKAVLEATDNQGADLILDFIGASYWDKNLTSIKTDGRWVLIGVMGGSKLENMNLMSLMSKRIQLTGTMLTPRSDAYKAELSREFAEEVLPYLEQGSIHPVLDNTFLIDDIHEAHQHMKENKNIGKIILDVGSEAN
ncbi:NAD(P)H-quinone oxidoreductase [Lentibacillus halophilus]|uniref:NAD(P)H-quinone oxidoreductase n=1 Tax=Lentibacillus halophilus TaxID=295065 RepID=A0ABP3IY32_9BACI